MIQLNPDSVSPAANLLERAQRQLDAVVRMLDEGQECEDVAHQLAAVSRPLDRAGSLSSPPAPSNASPTKAPKACVSQASPRLR